MAYVIFEAINHQLTIAGLRRFGAPLAVMLLLFLGTSSPVSSEDTGDDAAFLDWAKRHLLPISDSASGKEVSEFASLGRMIGNASVVGLGEAVHGSAEPLDFRNRLFNYLVEKKGFTAVAIESGTVEGHMAYDYVRGSRANLPDVMANGFSWTFGEFPQNAQLLEWLRAYNADPRHNRKINFYGLDVPGLGQPKVEHAADFAAKTVLAYLDKVDPAAATQCHLKLDPLLPYLQPPNNFNRPTPGEKAYYLLRQAQRDTYTSTIADIIALFQIRRNVYAAASGPEDYDWAYRAAVGAQETDLWFREWPADWHPGWEPKDSQARPFQADFDDIRSRSQFENLKWILRREGPGGKVLVFAHLVHMSAVPLDRQSGGSLARTTELGAYIRGDKGLDFVNIGNLVGAGRSGCADPSWQQEFKSKPRGTVEATLGQLQIPQFAIDVRKLTPEAALWFKQKTEVGQQATLYNAEIAKAFDILVYIDQIRPACAAR